MQDRRWSGGSRCRAFCARSVVFRDVNSLSAFGGAPQDWDAALEELLKLKELVDANTFMPMLQQLQQRTWLMHWGLFVFFNHENGRNLIIDNLFQDRCGLLPQEATRLCSPVFMDTIDGFADDAEYSAAPVLDNAPQPSCKGVMSGRTACCRYLNAVQTTSQHLLRYLAVAVVVNKRRRNVMKDLVKVLQQVTGWRHGAAAHVPTSQDDVLRICHNVFAAAAGMHGCAICSA
jgi:hypothetical protein